MTDLEKNNLKEAIAKQIAEIDENLIRLGDAEDAVAPDVAIGRLSRMEALSEKGVRQSNLNNMKQRKAKLEQNLAQIDNPGFGLCKRCGKAIPAARIEAIPEATLCVECA